MSTRTSGFARVDADLYETPAWVVDALAEHVQLQGLSVWEPACGTGKMARAIARYDTFVTATDRTDHGCEGLWQLCDFLDHGWWEPPQRFDAIITNPPFGPQGKTAEGFIEQGRALLRPGNMLALLLPVDFDSAKTRARFFSECPHFAAKIVLTRRITWFEPPPGEKRAAPSANHAWFIWERSHIRRGPAALLYAPGHPTEMS